MAIMHFILVSLIVLNNCKDIFAVAPSFDVPVSNVTVIVGKTAVLPCSVEYLGAHKVVWTDQFSTLLTFDINRINDDDRISVVRPFTNDWNLLIRDVKYSDAGKYVCQINTKPVKTKTVVLHVQVPPKIDADSSSSDFITREGQTVALTCNVSGIPPPAVHWFRRPVDSANNKEKLEPKKQMYNHSSLCTYTFPKTGVGMKGESLTIHNISRYCDGFYECVAFNDVPPAVTKEIKVEVEFAPEIEMRSRKIGQSPGKETILECEITAFPMGTSVWIFKNQNLLNSNKYLVEKYNGGKHKVTSVLLIRGVTYADYGNYTCFAQNKLGTAKDVMIMYDITVREKSISNMTTTTSMTTPLKKTIGVPVHGNDDEDESCGCCKLSSILYMILMVILCYFM